MSRPLRIQYPGAVHHIMNRGRVRQPTFVDETDYRAFLETLAEAHGLWGIEVFAYCLIGNHCRRLETVRGQIFTIDIQSTPVLEAVDGAAAQDCLPECVLSRYLPG
jgi:hypothetical protein